MYQQCGHSMIMIPLYQHCGHSMIILLYQHCGHSMSMIALSIDTTMPYHDKIMIFPCKVVISMVILYCTVLWM